MTPRQRQGPDPKVWAATSYTGRGWRVVPLHGIAHDAACTCNAGWSCRRRGSHLFNRLTPNGVLDATVIDATARYWFEAYPRLNVGIIPGTSGLVVVEAGLGRGGITIRKQNGLDLLQRLMEVHGPLPDTLTAEVPGVVRQYFFADPEGRLRGGRLAEGAIVKAGDSIVVVPPSLHVTGREGIWLNPLMAVASAPGWLASETEA